MTTTGLRAVTRRLTEGPGGDGGDGASVDLNDVARSDGYLFVRDGIGIAGRGVALRVDADTASTTLASIPHEDPHGSGLGPVAIGSVPFVPGSPSSLVVPAVIVHKPGDGRTWITTVHGGQDDPDHPDVAALTPPTEPVPTASSYSIEPGVAVDHYLEAVRAARDAVRAGSITKAVIARPIVVTSSDPIDVHAVLRRLKASFGSSHRFSIDGFIGASPELLVSVHDGIVRSHPLAGTAPRTGDAELDARIAAELVASTKNQVEHRVVVEMVHDTLLPWVSYLDWQPEPSIVAVANVQHLGSEVEGRLSAPAPDVVELVRALSPTPALGGHPRDEALALIAATEGFERGRYGGAVGWVDARGDGVWAVAIRCAELSEDRRTARLVAGGGIVADSEPLAELAETQAKFQAMLSALVRP
jgi:menaquinone-specific isochorismate synthase